MSDEQPAMNEFELIRRLQEIVNAGPHGSLRPGSVGIGDDAAVLFPEPGQQLVVTTDTLVPGVHFPEDLSPAEIGYRALAVNLSDLAAMGADPAWFFLALTLPRADRAWLEDFAAGMECLAADSGIPLAGGDTTSGPLSITITAIGQLPVGTAMLRGTARAGDLVVVSGAPGLAALGLTQHQTDQGPDPAAWHAFTRPQPRLALGRALRGKATAAIDISDGLAADLGHIARASQLGAEILLDRIPRPEALQQLDREACWDMQLGGGDDYELCFTLPPDLNTLLDQVSAVAGVSLTVVGEMTGSPGVRFIKPDGGDYYPARHGYVHFAVNPDCGEG